MPKECRQVEPQDWNVGIANNRFTRRLSRMGFGHLYIDHSHD